MIATDGSDAALGAARQAMELLRPGAAITVVAVVPERQDPMEDAGGFEGPVVTEQEAEDEWREGVTEGGGALARTADEVAGDQPVRTVLAPSDRPAGEALVRLAADEGADLIVVGSEQPGLFERIFGRSVTDQVVHHAPCPVLVVPHRS